MYPKKIKLTKLETLKDALYPQEIKYPSKKTIIEGYMWEYSLPKLNEAFLVFESKRIMIFHTSLLKNIEKIDENTMILTTLNSKYELKISNE